MKSDSLPSATNENIYVHGYDSGNSTTKSIENAKGHLLHAAFVTQEFL